MIMDLLPWSSMLPLKVQASLWVASMEHWYCICHLDHQHSLQKFRFAWTAVESRINWGTTLKGTLRLLTVSDSQSSTASWKSLQCAGYWVEHASFAVGKPLPAHLYYVRSHRDWDHHVRRTLSTQMSLHETPLMAHCTTFHQGVFLALKTWIRPRKYVGLFL